MVRQRKGEVEFFLAAYSLDGDLLVLDSLVRPIDTEGPPNGPVYQSFSARLPVGHYTIAIAALDTVDGNVGMAFTRIHP